jgi:hypothetical protein
VIDRAVIGPQQGRIAHGMKESLLELPGKVFGWQAASHPASNPCKLDWHALVITLVVCCFLPLLTLKDSGMRCHLVWLGPARQRSVMFLLQVDSSLHPVCSSLLSMISPELWSLPLVLYGGSY